MHPYSTDSTRQRTALLLIAVAAILLAWALGRVLDLLDTSAPWWLDTPAVVGFYGLLWQAYDRWIWRVRIGGGTVSGVPDFSGTWTADITSSYDPAVKYTGTLTVHQTASRLLVEYRTELSTSYSRLAMIKVEPGLGRGLQYVYNNQPSPLAPATMKPHEGTAYLKLADGGRALDGGYSTDPNRSTTGIMKFTREKAPSDLSRP
jgi:hypothetical protein